MSDLTKKWLIVIGSGLIVFLIPVPTGVKPIAWNLLAVFVATIVGCIVQPIPLGAISMTSLSLIGFLLSGASIGNHLNFPTSFNTW